MPALRVLLVCLAGPDIGMGHLARGLVAARALTRELGALVQVLVQGDSAGRPDLAAFPHQVITAQDDLCAAIDTAASASRADLLLFDLPAPKVPARMDAALALWRRQGRHLVAVDGLANHAALLSLRFVPAPQPPSAADLQAGCRLRQGWDCLLLDPLAETALPWLPGADALALTGGSDATGLGRHWPTQLAAALPAGSRLHWVTGPLAAPPQPPPSGAVAWQEHRALPHLGALMARCPQAVTVFGISLFELLQRGVASVVFSPYSGRDRAELAELRRSGAAWVATDATDAARSLARLMADPDQAAHLSRQARACLARNGGATLAAEVAALAACKAS